MRAWEILDEQALPPTKPISIRLLHKLKLEAKDKARQEQERFAIFSLMYGNADMQRERLELERLELEMAQLRAEIDATKAETNAKSAIALHKNAKQGIKAAQNSQDKITKLAKNSLGRELKP